MPTLAVIGDVHAHLEHLDQVLELASAAAVDGALLVGDIGSHDLGLARKRSKKRDQRYLDSMHTVLSRVGTLGVPVAWVPGNHDLPDLDLPGNVDRTVATIAGLRVAGIGGAGPDRYGFCYEWDEADVEARQVPDCDVLLCHAPPHGTPLDFVPKKNAHVGSRAIRQRALDHEGFLVCGHIHESPGAVQLSGCLCLNAGGLGRPHGRAQLGLLRRDAQGDAVGHVLPGRPARWWSRE